MDGFEQVPYGSEMDDSTYAALPEEAIRERAHELYELRGRQEGMEQEDWFQAESELRAETQGRQESMAASN